MNAAKLKTMYMLILYRLSFGDLELNMNKAWNHLISRVAHKLWFTPDNNFFLFPFFLGWGGGNLFQVYNEDYGWEGQQTQVPPQASKDLATPLPFHWKNTRIIYMKEGYVGRNVDQEREGEERQVGCAQIDNFFISSNYTFQFLKSLLVPFREIYICLKVYLFLAILGDLYML